jgi:acyl-CoA synthetase (AMP-forming)/AMP-acid ligase II
MTPGCTVPSPDAGRRDGPLRVHQLLDRAAATRPGAIAVTDATGRWTYASLAALTGRVHSWLSAQPVRPGDRVLAALPGSAHLLALMYACSRLGAIFVPLDSDITPYRLQHAVSDAEPSLALVAVGLADAAVAAGRVTTLSRLLRELRELPDHPAAPPAAEPGQPVMFLLYTSGSSSVPRAVICPHAAVLAAVRAIGARLRYRAADVVYCRLPLSFDYGLYQALLSAQARCEVVLDALRPAIGVLAAIRASRATVVPVMPILAGALAGLAARQGAPGSVRLLTSTGAPMPPSTADALRRQFPAARLSLMYGLTECKRAAMTDPYEEPADTRSAGRVIDGARLAVTAGGVRSAEPGRVGEIVISGPQVMAGYWRAPELTAAWFREDRVTGARWLHTGDRGYLDDRGRLHVLGRLDNTFSYRGVRTCAEEIEAAALDIPGVRGAVLQPPVPGADMILFVTGTRTAGEVIRGVTDRLGTSRSPRRCLLLPSLPVTPHGKADRQALAATAAGPAE